MNDANEMVNTVTSRLRTPLRGKLSEVEANSISGFLSPGEDKEMFDDLADGSQHWSSLYDRTHNLCGFDHKVKWADH